MDPSLYVEIDNMKIGLDNGYYENTFISHAHSDHIKGIKKTKRILSSKETEHILSINKDKLINNNLKMADAGHILGSRQLVCEEDGKKVVYTGDIRIKDGIFGKGAEIVECDKLIIESTYANRRFSFPNPFEVYEEIAKSISLEILKGNSILFGAYPLGKAQEIIKVINEYLSLPVIVDEKTNYFSKKYVELGEKLEFFYFGSEEAEEIMREPFIYLLSPRKAKKSLAIDLMFEYAMPFKLFYATGWIRKYSFSSFHKVFPLSDHADFRDLLYYIENSNANEVVLFGGDGKDLIHYKMQNNIPIKISTQ